MKIAPITGFTGQEGSYLAEVLLEKGHEVQSTKRRASLFKTQRVDHIYKDPHVVHQRFLLHDGDLTDGCNLIGILQQVHPNEGCNLGAQSHVAVSFGAPDYTAEVDAISTPRLLKTIRQVGLADRMRLYHASNTEFMAWYKNFRRTRAHRSTHAVTTRWPNSLPTESPWPEPTYPARTQPILSRVNVGTSIDGTIRELAETLARATGFGGRLVFDASKPDGALRKLMDVSRLAVLGWTGQVAHEDEPRDTFRWFLKYHAEAQL